MRPPGAARALVLAQLSRQPEADVAELVLHTGLGRDVLRCVLSNCVRAGVLAYRLERRAQAKRPVAVYRLAGADVPVSRVWAAPLPVDDGDVWMTLAACWFAAGAGPDMAVLTG